MDEMAPPARNCLCTPSAGKRTAALPLFEQSAGEASLAHVLATVVLAVDVAFKFSGLQQQ